MFIADTFNSFALQRSAMRFESELHSAPDGAVSGTLVAINILLLRSKIRFLDSEVKRFSKMASLVSDSMSKEQLQAERFQYVKYLWQDEIADKLSGLDRLVYRSNKLGEDLTLTNTGGGNTSSKLIEQDPLTRENVEVLWVKGSGGDLRTAKRDGFASLYLDKIRAMKSLYLNDPERGPKTEIEDAMYPMYSHCVFNLNPRACSIDTPLHTLVPYKHVDHLHPNAVIAVAASVNQEKLCKEIFGEDVIYVPWQRPGFDIGLQIEQLIKENPQAKGVLLGHHGMSSWSDDDKTCYETALEIIDRAARFAGYDTVTRARLRSW